MVGSIRHSVVLAAFALACSCAHDRSPTDPMEFSFGPFTIQPDQEISDQCVQITLHNTTDLYINKIDLETGVGFHHSNWLWVPEHEFPGPHGIDDSAADDGTFTCADRGFDQAIAAIYGGVLFAQSTQVAHEVQQFPEGKVVRIPPNSKLDAQIHLLNTGDSQLHLAPTITLYPIAGSDVTTILHGIAFEDQALGLPANAQSQFSLDCDLNPADQATANNWPAPDFNIYYVLGHYHALGTGLTLNALLEDDTTSTQVFQTTAAIGDTLGGPIDPPFAMGSNTHLQFACDYYNDTANVVGWGLGSAEMCVVLAFTDSAFNYGGGVTAPEDPGSATIVGDVQEFTDTCQVIASPAN